jgi:hypothetical protein
MVSKETIILAVIMIMVLLYLLRLISGLTPQPTTSPVCVFVKNADGDPVPNCSIEILNIDTGDTVLTENTNGNGTFNTTLPIGDYVVNALDEEKKIIGSKGFEIILLGEPVDVVVSLKIVSLRENI